MIVTVRDRDHNKFTLPQGLRLHAQRYRTTAQGGPQWAEVWASGEAMVLWRLLAWLRYDIEIHDDDGRPVWWGYVDAVDLGAGGVSVGVSLESMANRIAVIWSNDNDGGTTAWAEDADSVVTYGKYELLLSVDGVDEAGAEQRRNWELSRRRFPTPIVQPGRANQTLAVLSCRGEFDALSGTYYDRDEGLVEHIPGGGQPQKLGWGFTSSEVGFTKRGGLVSELHHKFNNLDKGEKVRVSGSVSNNGALTVETTSTRERQTVTATSIAFLQEVRNAGGEYIRASHDVARNLNNGNLFAETTAISTLAVTAAAAVETIQLVTVAGLASNDRIRIALDAGGTHQTFVSGEPDTGANTVKLRDALPSQASAGNAVDRVNRWVTNEAGDVYYTQSADYTIGALAGAITALSTGAITNNQVLKVSYRYIEYRIEDSNLGLGIANANDIIRVTGTTDADLNGTGDNDGYRRVLSSSGDGDRLTVRESVTDEGPGASVTIARGSNMTVAETLVDELPGASVTVTGWGTRVVQSFQIESDEAWTVNLLGVRVRKVGNPADNFRLDLQVDSAGDPGSFLEGLDIPAADVSRDFAWTYAQLANTTSLQPATSYWIRAGRSGADDPENYYEIAVDEDAGYADGVLRLFDGSAYQVRPVNGDMPFRVLGAEETTAQIAKLIAQEGQFLNGSDIVVTSGISTNQYRDGRTTAKTELVDLLEMGTANDRRLLATVTRDRILHVREEPAQPATPEYELTIAGEVAGRIIGQLPRGSMAFVGEWVRLKDLPPTADFSYVNAPSPFLAEAAEYDVVQDRYRIEPAGGLPAWRAGMSIDEG